MNHTPLVLLLLVLGMPSAMGDGSGYAPAHVAATSPHPDAALVAWAPGSDAADSFRVYGIDAADVPILLLDTAETANPVALAALVTGGYPAYAVAGVRDGIESQRVIAINGARLSCVTVELSPPGISERCTR